jgi:hypothetical protein
MPQDFGYSGKKRDIEAVAASFSRLSKPFILKPLDVNHQGF